CCAALILCTLKASSRIVQARKWRSSQRYRMIDAGIIEQLETARGARILIVGDIMLDRFVYGAAERLSPEAPVPVLKFDRESVMPGGAANVARNVSEFGASVELIGLVGRDGARDELQSLIDACPGCRLS